MKFNNVIARPSCPLCQNKENIVHINFPIIPVVKCKNCNFMYSSKVLSDENISQYYEKNFGGERHLQGQIVNSKINLMVLNKMLQMESINSILDVGTGYGLLLKEIKEHWNIKCTGVELSQQEADYAQ